MLTLGESAGLQRTDFQPFPLWEDVVILKVLISGNVYIERMWCIKMTDFQHISLWKGVVVLKGLILDNFTFEGCGGHD